MGSRVVHYGIKNGLHLNYYRTGGVKLVHGVDPDADEAMLFNVGGQAGVPVSSQKSGYTARLVQEAGSSACPRYGFRSLLARTDATCSLRCLQ